MANRPMVHTGDKVSGKGRNRTFETPEDLMGACEEYLAWNEAHPLFEEKPFMYQGQIIMAEMPKPRAPSVVALCTHLGIHRHTWQNYRISEEFDMVCEEIEARMRTFKFERAVAGLMNPTLIARDIGLVEKSSVDLTSGDGTMSPQQLTFNIIKPKDAV